MTHSDRFYSIIMSYILIQNNLNNIIHKDTIPWGLGTWGTQHLYLLRWDMARPIVAVVPAMDTGHIIYINVWIRHILIYTHQMN